MRDAKDDFEYYAYPTQRMWKLNIFYKIIYKFSLSAIIWF